MGRSLIMTSIQKMKKYELLVPSEYNMVSDKDIILQSSLRLLQMRLLISSSNICRGKAFHVNLESSSQKPYLCLQIALNLCYFVPYPLLCPFCSVFNMPFCFVSCSTTITILAAAQPPTPLFQSSTD
eukprot:c15536_g1_i1 orf=811-1191(+)